MIAVVLVIVILLVRAVVMHHETSYEKVARELTDALQQNDIAAVDKLQNSETRAHVTRAAVGHAAEVFKPLDRLDRVRETAVDGETHEFDAFFDKGTVHETIQFDPDNRVVHFKFDPPTPK
jgi:predicted Holliday junction resolvase-like endonuclease